MQSNKLLLAVNTARRKTAKSSKLSGKIEIKKLKMKMTIKLTTHRSTPIWLLLHRKWDSLWILNKCASFNSLLSSKTCCSRSKKIRVRTLKMINNKSWYRAMMMKMICSMMRSNRKLQNWFSLIKREAKVTRICWLIWMSLMKMRSKCYWLICKMSMIRILISSSSLKRNSKKLWKMVILSS
jgi:hypothetical protein